MRPSRVFGFSHYQLSITSQSLRLSLPMPNSSGANQYGMKECTTMALQCWNIDLFHLDPSDEQLRAQFQQYGWENAGSGLTWQEQQARLKATFNLDIG